MVIDASLLNTHYYTVRIKGKVGQSKEWNSAPRHLGVVAIEKGAFGFYLLIFTICNQVILSNSKWLTGLK